MKKKQVIIFNDTPGVRLDVFLSGVTEFSRTRIQNMISSGKVSVNGISTRAQYRLRSGDNIQVEEPEKKTSDIIPEDIPLEFIYEDDDFAVINKKRGMVVHPATSHNSGTVVNAILYHFKENISPGSSPERPGIIHRIDKGTSGILIVTKTEKMQNAMSSIFMNRQIEKRYLAIVKGIPSSENGRIELPIKRDRKHRKKMTVSENGKNAITLFKTIENLKGYTYLSVNILTGRTHQIRVHFSYLGNPILNDTLYGYNGREFELDGFALHASSIAFKHPYTGEKMYFEAPLPDDFSKTLDLLRSES